MAIGANQQAGGESRARGGQLFENRYGSCQASARRRHLIGRLARASGAFWLQDGPQVTAKGRLRRCGKRREVPTPRRLIRVAHTGWSAPIQRTRVGTPERTLAAMVPEVHPDGTNQRSKTLRLDAT